MFEGVRISCDACKRHFRRWSSFDNHRRKRDSEKKLYVCASDVAVRAEDSQHAKILSLIDDIVKIVIRTEKPVNCVT